MLVFFRCVRARANLRALMTQKSCAVGMRNAILRNHLNIENTRTLTNLRMRLKQIGFVPMRIAPQREQGVT